MRTDMQLMSLPNFTALMEQNHNNMQVYSLQYVSEGVLGECV